MKKQERSRYTPPHPPFPPCRRFGEMHRYNDTSQRMQLLNSSTPNPHKRLLHLFRFLDVTLARAFLPVLLLANPYYSVIIIIIIIVINLFKIDPHVFFFLYFIGFVHFFVLRVNPTPLWSPKLRKTESTTTLSRRFPNFLLWSISPVLPTRSLRACSVFILILITYTFPPRKTLTHAAACSA